MQGGKLVQLVNHRRGLWRGRCGLGGLRRRLLLFELAEALVLLLLRLIPLLPRRPMLRPATYAPPPTTPARSNGRRRGNISDSLVVYCSCLAGSTARPVETGREPP